MFIYYESGGENMKYKTTHTAYYNSEGVQVPSVTTVLQILNKPFLMKWANFMGFKRKNIDAILEESAMVGTIVHELIHAYMTKAYYIWTGLRVAKTLVMAYFNSFLEWKKTHTIEMIFMEEQLISDRYAGTSDFYGVVDGKFTILDFKTSKKPYSSMFLQLAAYCIILEAMGRQVDQVGIIIINADGYNEKFISREKLQPYMDTFIMLVELFHKWYDLNESEGWGNILAK
jgi:predicted RecB family nuclease